MSKVLAKFDLESCQPQYETGHQDDIAFLVGAQVTFNAVQGEPFGKYTPFGRIQMGILNPAAAAVFVKVWDAYKANLAAYLVKQVPLPLHPQFSVTFQLDEEEGAQ